MKTWVWVCVAIVGGYFVYRGWFGPDETGDANDEPLILEPESQPESGEPPADADAPVDEPRRIDLDVEGAGAGEGMAPVRDEAAWALEQARRVALKEGDEAAAKEQAERILAEHPESDPARWLEYEKGRRHLVEYERLGRNKAGLEHARLAWRHLTPALFLRQAAPAEKKELLATLRKLAKIVLLNGRHVDGVDFMYTPRSGDSLSVLCRKVFPKRGAKVAPGFLVSVNGMGSPRGLRAGEPIKVPLGESEIVVVKGEFRLYFLHQGGYVRDFPVGLGREGSTPETEFFVRDKLRNPNWNPRPGVTIPYGHPENILGTRWMAFNNTAEYRGFGIHGTSQPSSIGKEASSGCVRMLRADVELLFDWTPRGTKVRILP